MVQWDETLWLFTEEEFNQLPNGIRLKSISGNFATKGIDDIDTDTRFGHIAFGIEDPLSHPEAELFTTFRLQS